MAMLPRPPSVLRRPARRLRLHGAWGLAACLGLLVPMLARSAPVQWSTDQVTIDFDPDTFVFQNDTTYGGLQNVSPDSVGYVQSGQGVVLNLGGLVSAYASSYPYFSEDNRSASFSAWFDFAPKAEIGRAHV